MKFKLVAAVFAMLFVGAVSATEIYNKNGNKLNLYGKVVGLHYFSDDMNNNGDKTYVRFGFKSEIQINDQLIGYGKWEHGFKGKSDETSRNRTSLSFVGLKFNELGSFNYGRNYGVAYDVGVFTNILPEHSVDTWVKADNFMTGSASGVATYRNDNFFGLINGLSFAVQHQSKNDRDDVTTSNGSGWGLSSSYKFSDFNVAAAYTKSDRTSRQIGAGNTSEFNANGMNANVWVTGLKYDANDIYLATTYAETHNMTNFGNNHIASKAQNFEAVARYNFDFGLRPSLGYLYSRGRRFGSYGDQDLVKCIELGTSYLFDKNMFTYVDYKINLLRNNEFTKAAGIKTDNIVALGLIYQF